MQRGHTEVVTKVYITRTGERYHVDEDCPSFADAERENGRPIVRWSQDLRGLSHSQCQVRWPTSRGPGWQYYGRTVAEECFESEQSAIDAGYRASEVQ